MIWDENRVSAKHDHSLPELTESKYPRDPKGTLDAQVIIFVAIPDMEHLTGLETNCQNSEPWYPLTS